MHAIETKAHRGGSGLFDRAVVVSVVIPMRNAAAYVERTLQSICAERAVPLEVVVVDDGSTDASRAIAMAFPDPRVRVIDGPRSGLSACLNAGYEAARGAVLMRCDADDLYPPSRIRDQVQFLALHPACDAVSGAFSTIDAAGRPIAKVAPRDGEEAVFIEPELRRGDTRTSFCTFAVRRAAFERVGGFRDFFETAEDIDFQLRLGEFAQVAYLPVDTYFYRLHGTSITHSQPDERRCFFEATARSFLHERMQAGTDRLMRGDPPTPPHKPAKTVHGSFLSEQICGMLVAETWAHWRDGERRAAMNCAWRAVEARPAYWLAWRNLFVLTSKMAAPRRRDAARRRFERVPKIDIDSVPAARR